MRCQCRPSPGRVSVGHFPLTVAVTGAREVKILSRRTVFTAIRGYSERAGRISAEEQDWMECNRPHGPPAAGRSASLRWDSSGQLPATRLHPFRAQRHARAGELRSNLLSKRDPTQRATRGHPARIGGAQSEDRCPQRSEYGGAKSALQGDFLAKLEKFFRGLKIFEDRL